MPLDTSYLSLKLFNACQISVIGPAIKANIGCLIYKSGSKIFLKPAQKFYSLTHALTLAFPSLPRDISRDAVTRNVGCGYPAEV